MALQVLEEAAGQPDAASRSHGLSHLLFAKLVIIRTVLFGVRGVDKGLAHLLQELVNKDPLHFGADFGQVAALVVRVLGLILQRMQGTKA